MPITARLEHLRQALAQAELDCLVVAGPANRFYLSGFTGEHGVLTIGREGRHLFTDFRFLEQAGLEAPSYTVNRCPPKLLPEVGRWLDDAGVRRIGIEAAHLSLADYRELAQAVPEERMVPTTRFVEELRAVKEPAEIEAIARAAEMTDRAWQRILPLIRPGVSEKDLAAELDHLLCREGADRPAFSTIVASGPRGAMPHGVASGKRLARGELVVFDFGAVFNGYASDMTRTVALGEPGEEARAVYRLVAEAQAMALAALRPGMSGREADAVARRHIERAGHAEHFGHGLGHSVGIEVHEDPRLSLTGEQILAPGMVVTVEPGVYLPGFCGVRLEDLVVLTETGCRNLTGSPKELILDV